MPVPIVNSAFPSVDTSGPDLVCDAPRVFIGDEPNDPNPVVSVEISYVGSDHAWKIFHHHANGLVAARAQQYAIEDATNNKRTAWAGSLNRNRALFMTGEIQTATNGSNDYLYIETLYNRARGNHIDMQMSAHCTLQHAAPTYQPAPLSQAAPQAAPPVMAYDPPRQPPAANWSPATKRDAVPIYPGDQGATVRVDVLLGGFPVRMMLDTGATTALIPTDLAKRIVDSGNGTWQGQSRFRMADGSIRLANVLNIRDVRIGSHVLHDVRAGVADGDDMLLDFPTVNRIGPFTIDTRNRELVFNTEQDADGSWHPQRSSVHF
jgi:hypothetical protein